MESAGRAHAQLGGGIDQDELAAASEAEEVAKSVQGAAGRRHLGEVVLDHGLIDLRPVLDPASDEMT
ncbi:hypothetical protein [Rhodococcus jostii]|uniref:hypothetical protein n=1 Tax=Rhodococcus jostii TaxID=132919 RepID=UPI001F0785A3|nr:hypothetical protein [Rhodococcus jostii]